MGNPVTDAAHRALVGHGSGSVVWLAESAHEALKPLQAKHSEWVASLKASDHVASAVALAVLDDLAPMIFPPDCQHEWRAFEDEAVKTSGDQEWTCALCGDMKVESPPIKAITDEPES